MRLGWLRLRRFAGFTPWNAVDRITENRERARAMIGWRPPARFSSYYGPQRDLELFVAFSTFRGSAYRAGDAGRRAKR